MRRLLQHKNYNDLDIFRGPVDDLIRILQQGEAVVDLQPLFFRMTFDATTSFVFGETVRSLVADRGSDAQRFVDAFDIVQKHASCRMRRCDLGWMSNWRAYQQACKDLNEFTDRAIGYGDASHVLDMLSQETPDPIALRGQILNLLAAGRDTTASLLSWTLCVASQIG